MYTYSYINMLDPVEPKALRPVFASVFSYLQQRQVIDSFRSFANTLLIALDGTGYFYSESIHCPSCTVAHHRDGHKKQDCERAAAKRWIDSVAPQYGPLGITLLGDDIYACQPMIEKVLAAEMNYIFVAKPRSLPVYQSRSVEKA